MKIVTKISFEVVSDRPLVSLALVGVGETGFSAVDSLADLLTEACADKLEFVILGVATSVQPNRVKDAVATGMVAERYLPPEAFEDWKNRLEARLDEVDEADAGEWILSKDRLPPLTVLGLFSAVCEVRTSDGGILVDAMYSDADQWWKSPDGKETYFVTAWREKKGIAYEDPQARYEQVAEENRIKGYWTTY